MIDPRQLERIAASIDALTKAVNKLDNSINLAREKGIPVDVGTVNVTIENTDYPIAVSTRER